MNVQELVGKVKDVLVSLTISTLVVAPSVVYAATSATVNATVTVQNVSVSVADGTVTYGTLAVNTAKDTTNTGTDDSQTATNDGNVAADLNIRGQNTAAWTLAGSASSNQYMHQFCKTNCDSSPTWTALTTSNQTLTSAVSASGTQVFDLKITTPTSSSSYTQQSVDVIVQASAS
jgi:hypothetical protein